MLASHSACSFPSKTFVCIFKETSGKPAGLSLLLTGGLTARENDLQKMAAPTVCTAFKEINSATSERFSGMERS
jgi:hypothetical protein